MQYYPPLRIGQHGVKIVGGLRAGPKLREVHRDAYRQAKQHHDWSSRCGARSYHMPLPGTRLLTPALAHLWSEAIEMRLEVTHLPQLTFVDQRADR